MARSARRGERQIAWFQVASALLLLVVFGVSFGVVFEYATPAVQSLEADIYGPTYCTIVSARPVRNVTCDEGWPPVAPCYVVRAVPDGGGGGDEGDDSAAAEQRTASAVLHPFYRDYYRSKDCSYTLCYDSGQAGPLTAARRSKQRQLKMAADRVGGNNETGVVTEAVRCWLDRRKPGRAFLGLNEDAAAAAHEAEGNGTSLVFSKEKAYAVLVVPPAVMLGCVAALVACIATGKVKADEVHEAVVTPNHIEINGKWYVRSPRPRPAGDDGERLRRQLDAEKWQTLKQALRH